SHGKLESVRVVGYDSDRVRRSQDTIGIVSHGKLESVRVVGYDSDRVRRSQDTIGIVSHGKLEPLMDREVIRRRHLPHWDVPGATYFVTTCLHGSIPAQGLLEVARFREKLQGRPRPKTMTEQQWQTQCWKLVFVEVERWLDTTPANHALED